MNQEQLNQLLLHTQELIQINLKLSQVSTSLTALNWSLAFFIGIFSCTYLFSFVKGIFDK